MSPETVEAIKSALIPVAEKIGQGAAFGWEVVVRQQYVEGWIAIFVAGLALIFSATLALVAWKSYDERSYDNFGTFLCSILAVVAVFVFAGATIHAITHFLNPEFYALQFFIGMVK